MLIPLLLAASIQQSPPPSMQLLELTAPPASNAFGFSATAVGDVDPDGHIDVAVSASEPGLTRVRVHSGIDGKLLLEHTQAEPSGPLEFAITSLAAAGDANADGLADLLVSRLHRVETRSGVDLALLHEHVQGATLTGLPVGARAGDVDGADDVLIGEPMVLVVNGGDVTKIFNSGSGRATLRSGMSGALMRVHDGVTYGSAYGGAVCSAGDVDADGVPDYAIACWLPSYSAQSALEVRSGATGAPLHQLDGAPEVNGGARPALLGDANGDGVPDLVIGQRTADAVHVLSGLDASVLATRTVQPWPGQVTPRYGWIVAPCGDADGDGHADALIGAPQLQPLPVTAGGLYPNGPGFLEVLSGQGAALLAHLDGQALGDGFGQQLAGVGDLNGDGRPDVLASAPSSLGGDAARGRAWLLSTAPLALSADVHALSIAQGGTQHFALAAGAAHAGEPYLVLASGSGIAPAAHVGALAIPLVPDVWTSFALQSPNAAPYAHGLGFLDGAGNASASLSLPSGVSSSLSGLVLHHAFVAFDAQLVPHVSSGACVVVLEP